jgi:hypothetical protein
LLRLYPARYRLEYGESMRQVFRASLRDAARRRGVAGITRLWLRTLRDLLLTALAERMELTMTQAPAALYRATGLVSLVGIVMWIVGPILLGVGMAFASASGAAQPMSMMVVLPVGWLFFVIGFIGLYSWLARQCGPLVWIPGALVIVTLLTMIVAALYWSYNSQIGVSYEGSTTVVNLGQASAVNQLWDYYAYEASYLAYPVLGILLIATGLLALRFAPSRAAARTLLVMGAITALYYFFTDMRAPHLLRNTGTPGLIGMAAGALVFAAVWLIGWLRLGRWLWRAGVLPLPAAPLTVAPSLD